MKSWVRGLLAGVGLLLALAAALLWWLPARWAWPWLAPRLHGVALEGVGGTLWDGHADTLRAPDGRPLGRLRWNLSHRLLLGATALDLALDGPQLAFAGHVDGGEAGKQTWRDVHASADLAALPRTAALPAGAPRGRIELDLPRLVSQGGWPLELAGTARWRDAAFDAPDGRLALGAFHADLQASGGAVQARFADDGDGPLAATGELQLIPLGWRATARVRPRTDDAALRRWLSAFGRPQADGTVVIRRGGGLLRAADKRADDGRAATDEGR